METTTFTISIIDAINFTILGLILIAKIVVEILNEILNKKLDKPSTTGREADSIAGIMFNLNIIYRVSLYVLLALIYIVAYFTSYSVSYYILPLFILISFYTMIRWSDVTTLIISGSLK